MSIEYAQLPNTFNTARVVPLLKKGPKNEEGNYRPISVLSSVLKILEIAIFDKIIHFFK